MIQSPTSSFEPRTAKTNARCMTRSHMISSSRFQPAGARLAWAVLWCLLFITLSACSSTSESGEPPTRPGPALADTVGGVRYEGDLRIMESFPVQLAADVTVTNVSGETRELVFPDGCVVLLRAYRGTELAFDQASVLSCTQALVEVELASGQSRTFSARSDGYEVLGDSLPDGRYRMTAYLRPNGGVVEVELGEVDLAIPR
jgi:hypothetical protein